MIVVAMGGERVGGGGGDFALHAEGLEDGEGRLAGSALLSEA